MIDREDELGRRIAQHLDAGLGDIDATVLGRLRSAREGAVLRLNTAPAWSLAAAGPAWGVMRYLSPRYLLPLAALLIVVVGTVYWHQALDIDDVADIDAQLLSGDLPIDAYLDKGLDTWLKRTSY